MVSRPARCNGNERWPDPSSRQCAADSQSAARHVSISQHVRSFGGSHRSSWNDSACQSSSLLFFSTVQPATHFHSRQFRRLLLMFSRCTRNETGARFLLASLSTAGLLLFPLLFFRLILSVSRPSTFSPAFSIPARCLLTSWWICRFPVTTSRRSRFTNRRVFRFYRKRGLRRM